MVREGGLNATSEDRVELSTIHSPASEESKATQFGSEKICWMSIGDGPLTWGPKNP